MAAAADHPAADCVADGDPAARRVVSQGHSKAIRDTKLIAAGKTGTSSRTSDVWFVGFTSRWLTTAWVGDDTYEAPAHTDASFTVSVPMWARYMYAATHEMPLGRTSWRTPADGQTHDRWRDRCCPASCRCPLGLPGQASPTSCRRSCASCLNPAYQTAGYLQADWARGPGRLLISPRQSSASELFSRLLGAAFDGAEKRRPSPSRTAVGDLLLHLWRRNGPWSGA